MSTPNPALVAAAPTLIQALRLVQQFVTTVMTGDPAQIPLRVAPAIAILDSQIILLAPQLLAAEQGVVLSQATTGINNLITKLEALVTPPAA